MTPQSADAARNSHHQDTQENTTTQPTTRTPTTNNTSNTTKNQDNNHKTNTNNQPTNQINNQDTNHKNQTKNQQQSTNRAGIRMPPAGGPRETAPLPGPSRRSFWKRLRGRGWGCVMPRSGHLDRLFHGTNLAIQVGYRLGGIRPQTSLSQQAIEIQVDYRLGDPGTDSRAVWFLGDGPTAELLRYRPGDRVTAADGAIVRDAMFGIDRRTGERMNRRMRRNPHARIAAWPLWTVISEACAAAGIDPRQVHSGRDLAAQMDALAKAGQRARGTVVFATASDLLRSNEHAWTTYDKAIAAGQEVDPPAFRIDRSEVMRRLGALQRRLQTGPDERENGPEFDLTLDDHVLGAAVWDAVAADAEIMIESGVAGFEMTLTCPKSLSVAALLAPEDTREQWLELVRDASREAVDELMRRVGHGRTGHEGGGQSAAAIRGLGYAATVSVEAHSRALDPHLHGHVMIPNRVLCVDGKERGIATGGTDLMNHSWWLQAQFERRLRALSVERGLVASWEMDHRTRQWEVTGADPDILAFYSQDTPPCRPRSSHSRPACRWR